MNPCSGARDWGCSFKKKVPVKKGIGQRNRIGMNGCNEISPRSEVLRTANGGGKIGAKEHSNVKTPCTRESHHREGYEPKKKPTSVSIDSSLFLRRRRKCYLAKDIKRLTQRVPENVQALARCLFFDEGWGPSGEPRETAKKYELTVYVLNAGWTRANTDF
jgi:hypothetical protein